MSYEEPHGRQPTEEELRAAMEEQMRRITVQDVLLQTVVTLVNLAGRRLGLAEGAEEERDLEQARLAIEGTRALVELLPAEESRAVRDALSQLQMAYARQAGAHGAPAEGEAPDRGDRPPQGAPDQGPASPSPAEASGGGAEPEEAERARARSKIWTPPGT